MTYIIDAKRTSEKEKAHEYLSTLFDFPDYYGKNLDAFDECFRDVVRKGDSVEIINYSEDNGYLEKILEVIKENETEVILR